MGVELSIGFFLVLDELTSDPNELSLRSPKEGNM